MKRCVGFVNVEVLFAPLAGSPKFQLVFVTPPEDVPLNSTGLQIGVVIVKSIEPTGIHGEGEHGAAVMVITFDVALHPFASVTTTEYDPVAVTTIVGVVCPPGDHE